ncbi:MAG: SulP family inorganic anion transporter [Endomicrobiaceae bacterium]|nr:SulP family inorganic anion transporter [Endomicrobiaceae bacterium]
MFRPKLFTLLKNKPEEFKPHNILKEIMVGLIISFISIPLSIALAIASGVSLEKGLITGVIAGIIVSVFGGSRVQIAGPTGAFVVIVYGIVQKFGIDGLIVATAMAGIILVVMGFLKFGSVLKYIPDPLIIGFTSGIAVVLFSTQINDFFGLSLKNIPSEFIPQWKLYLANIVNVNFQTLALGIGSLLFMFFYPKRFKFFPASLAVIVISTLAVKFFNFNVDTIYTHFGDISKTVSFMPKIPSVNIDMLVHLMPSAFIIAFLAAIESLLSAVVADGMIEKKHRSNTEVIAQGFANLGSAVFGGVPATGAIARTSAGITNGARTPIAGIANAIFIFIAMIFCMQYVQLIPMVVLATILFNVAYRMIDFRAFSEITKAPKNDTLVLITTFLLTVFVNLIYAIEIGVVLASLLFMKRMSDMTNISVLDQESDFEDEIEDSDGIDKKIFAKDVVVHEITGAFFFGAASTFVEHMENIKQCKVIILRMRKVPVMDATGYNALYKIYKRCKKTNTRLILCHIQKQPLKLLTKYNFINDIGRENISLNLNSALKQADKYIKSLVQK